MSKDLDRLAEILCQRPHRAEEFYKALSPEDEINGTQEDSARAGSTQEDTRDRPKFRVWTIGSTAPDHP
jgi:hypothetical protein